MQYPDLNCARVARSFMVRYFSESLIGYGRPSNTIFNQAAVQIVSKPPRPQQWGPIYLFCACRPCGPAGWLALLLTKVGDVETNPGPTTLNKKVWISDICHKQIHVRKQLSIRGNTIEHWVHIRCAGIQYNTIHRYLDLPSTQRIQTHTSHRHNTTPPLPTLVQSPTHSPPTPPTPPQPKHRHMSNTHPVPTGLVKPKPKSLIHSTPFTPTPPRAKHIHLSEARHLYYTKHLNHVYYSYTHSPQPHLTRTPHHHCRHPRTLTLSQHTHMQHKQQYMHHSHRNNRTHNIGYYDNLTNRPRTTI